MGQSNRSERIEVRPKTRKGGDALCLANRKSARWLFAFSVSSRFYWRVECFRPTSRPSDCANRGSRTTSATMRRASTSSPCGSSTSEKIEDASGRGHTGTLRGGKISPDGRFGACLETFRGWPVEDKEHRALIENRPDLSPQGPFTLELWIKPKPELNADYPNAFLLDKKYVAHADYQLVLGPPDAAGPGSLRVDLGFGGRFGHLVRQAGQVPAGHVVSRRLHVRRQRRGELLPQRPALGQQADRRTRGRSPPARIPCRSATASAATTTAFPGFIDQVRISSGVLEFRRARRRADFRPGLLRPHGIAGVAAVRGDQPSAHAAGRGGGAAFLWTAWPRRPRKLAELAPGKPVAVDYPLDTSLRPDAYRLAARLHVAGPEPYQSQEEFPVRIVPRQPPHRFPVLMWGIWQSARRAQGDGPAEADRLHPRPGPRGR